MSGSLHHGYCEAFILFALQLEVIQPFIQSHVHSYVFHHPLSVTIDVIHQLYKFVGEL